MALSGGNDKTIIRWRVGDGKKMREYKGHSGSVKTVAFTPAGDGFISGDKSGQIRIWETENSKSRSLIETNNGSINALCFNGLGDKFFSGGDDGRLTLWSRIYNERVAVFVDSGNNQLQPQVTTNP
ncbi:MAG: hypothetical protein KDH98_22160 [Calditrichaeota bacterium]|nr:hypothetical protein [Calditrichota bacterium]